jgi:hypothetical protein
MLGARFASSEKVSELDFSCRSAGRHVGFVQDEGASIVVATQQPSIAVLAVVDLALAIGHLGPPRKQLTATQFRSRKSQAQGYFPFALSPVRAIEIFRTRARFLTADTDRCNFVATRTKC